MKLELKEVTPVETPDNIVKNDFTNFQDILNCFERQKNSFEQIEKELIISPFFQIIFTFSFFLFIHPLLTLSSLSIKFAIAYFFQKFVKKMNLDFSFSSFISSVCSFSSNKLKNKNQKIYVYQNEKRKFLYDFFSFPINKELILNYLHNFYQNNEYRLSSNVYSEIDSIKIAIENENYELAFENIIKFKTRINYIKELETHSY